VMFRTKGLLLQMYDKFYDVSARFTYVCFKLFNLKLGSSFVFQS
jgi:hypothetical protein